MAVIITESAAREINNIMAQQELVRDKTHLRVGVKGGGCSGFSYILDLTEAKKDDDEQWDYEFSVDGESQDFTSFAILKVISTSTAQRLILG